MNKSNKNKTVVLLLCIFLGYLGIHRFYVGKNKSAILYFFTGGLFGIGWIYDIFNIANNLFTDSYGAVLTNENANQNFINENKKKPAHMMWQFWVAVVVLYVFIFATPSNSNNEPTQQTSTTISETETDTDTSQSVKTDSTDISVTDDKNDYLFILNTDSKEYHLDENCNSVFFPDDKNRTNFTVTADDKKEAILYVESLGYSDCYKCVDKNAIDKYEEYVKNLNSDAETENDTDTDSDTDTSTETNTNTDTDTNMAVETDTASDIETVSEKTTSVVSSESTSSTYVELPPQATTYHFIINEESKKFHRPSCSRGQEISSENRNELDVTDEKLSDAIQRMIGMGYSPCGVCLD